MSRALMPQRIGQIATGEPSQFVVVGATFKQSQVPASRVGGINQNAATRESYPYPFQVRFLATNGSSQSTARDFFRCIHGKRNPRDRGWQQALSDRSIAEPTNKVHVNRRDRSPVAQAIGKGPCQKIQTLAANRMMPMIVHTAFRPTAPARP